jgi:hypothetical protein
LDIESDAACKNEQGTYDQTPAQRFPQKEDSEAGHKRDLGRHDDGYPGGGDGEQSLIDGELGADGKDG